MLSSRVKREGACDRARARDLGFRESSLHSPRKLRFSGVGSFEKPEASVPLKLLPAAVREFVEAIDMIIEAYGTIHGNCGREEIGLFPCAPTIVMGSASNPAYATHDVSTACFTGSNTFREHARP